jgi:hypothetical protein
MRIGYPAAELDIGFGFLGRHDAPATTSRRQLGQDVEVPKRRRGDVVGRSPAKPFSIAAREPIGRVPHVAGPSNDNYS